MNKLGKDEQYIPRDGRNESRHLQLLQQSPGQAVLFHVPHLRRDLLLYPYDEALALPQAGGAFGSQELVVQPRISFEAAFTDFMMF
jgi:hypothetical protein